jgi:hypothetical protein
MPWRYYSCKELITMKHIMKDRLLLTQKILVGVFLMGIFGSILLMINGIQNFIISIVEKAVLGRPLNNPVKWHSLLAKISILGIFSCFSLITLVLFYKQCIRQIKKLLSVNVADRFLNKMLTKRICGITIKEILVKQPFLLLFFLFILYFVKNIFLVINITGFDEFVIVLTLLTHIIVSFFIYSKNEKFIVPILICYGILFFSVLVNSFIFDYSWDGQAYHQVTTIQLNNGWNPFCSYLKDGVFIWSNHYPKFTEMFSSILLSVFNNIELGKSYSMIFFIIVFLYALKYTSKFQKKKLTVIAIAIIFTVNPVVIAQFFTYYVDGIMGMLIIILFFACMEYEQSQNITDLLIIIAVSVFSINTKFTGFICGFVLIAYIIKQLAMKKYKIMTFLICASFTILMIGVVFTGYNPYITNTRDFGHPFYPLFGNKAVDIISSNQIDEWTFVGFNIMHPIKKFFSLFFLDYSIKNIPFNPVKIINFKSLFFYDRRIGGFGILLAEIYILSFLILFFTIKNRNIKYYKKLLFPMVILLFISIIMPENWWARYIPFFWYLPGFIAMAGDYKCKINKNIFLVCFIIVIVNSGSFLIFNTFNGIRYSMGFKSFLREIEASNQDTIHIVLSYDYFSYSIAEKFRYYNIQKNIIFIEEEDKKFSNGVPFSNIKGWY